MQGLSPKEVRHLLGEDLSQDLVNRVTERLDVDVLVLDLSGDGYTLAVGGRSVIIVKRTPYWFRQNFSIAHELGHLATGDLCEGRLMSDDAVEVAANSFAAELLMPEAEIRSINWETIDLGVLADRLWNWGVSTKALDVRLQMLQIYAQDDVRAALEGETQSLLRTYWQRPPGPDPIASRLQRAAERHFPIELISRLEVAVMEGRAPAGSLAFALGTTEDELELDLSRIADPAADIHLLDDLVDP